MIALTSTAHTRYWRARRLGIEIQNRPDREEGKQVLWPEYLDLQMNDWLGKVVLKDSYDALASDAAAEPISLPIP